MSDEEKWSYCDVLECAESKPCCKHPLSLHTLLLLFGDNEKGLYKYKWCNKTDCLVEMRIPTPDEYRLKTMKFECNEDRPKTMKFECNEDRANVFNPLFAKFRCNGLFVTRIYDLIHMAWVNEATSNFGRLVTNYKVGHITFPIGYDTYPHRVCSYGIHYFNRVEAAIYYRDEMLSLLFDHKPKLRLPLFDIWYNGYISKKVGRRDDSASLTPFLYNEYKKQPNLLSSPG